jgi:hypothetical protein
MRARISLGMTVALLIAVRTAIFEQGNLRRAVRLNVMRAAQSKQRARGRRSAAGLFLLSPLQQVRL